MMRIRDNYINTRIYGQKYYPPIVSMFCLILYSTDGHDDANTRQLHQDKIRLHEEGHTKGPITSRGNFADEMRRLPKHATGVCVCVDVCVRVRAFHGEVKGVH